MSNKTCLQCKHYFPPTTKCPRYAETFSCSEKACVSFEQDPDMEKKPPTVFDRITASPEVLAEETVYMDYNYDKKMCGFTTPFIDEMFLIEEQQGKDHEEKYFNARNAAIAATVARLKEVGESD